MQFSKTKTYPQQRSSVSLWCFRSYRLRLNRTKTIISALQVYLECTWSTLDNAQAWGVFARNFFPMQGIHFQKSDGAPEIFPSRACHLHIARIFRGHRSVNYNHPMFFNRNPYFSSSTARVRVILTNVHKLMHIYGAHLNTLSRGSGRNNILS